MQENPKLSRRDLLKILGLGASTVAVSACVGPSPSTATSEATATPASTDIPKTATDTPEPIPSPVSTREAMTKVVYSLGGYQELSAEQQIKFDEQWKVLSPWLEWWSKPEANPKSDPIANPTGEGAGSYISGVTITDTSWRGLEVKFVNDHMYFVIRDSSNPDQDGSVIMPNSTGADTYIPQKFPDHPQKYDPSLTPVYMSPRPGESVEWGEEKHTFVSVSDHTITRYVDPRDMLWKSIEPTPSSEPTAEPVAKGKVELVDNLNAGQTMTIEATYLAPITLTFDFAKSVTEQLAGKGIKGLNTTDYSDPANNFGKLWWDTVFLTIQRDNPKYTHEQFLTDLSSGKDLSYVTWAYGPNDQIGEQRVDPRKPVRMEIHSDLNRVRPERTLLTGDQYVERRVDADGSLSFIVYVSPAYFAENQIMKQGNPRMLASSIALSYMTTLLPIDEQKRDDTKRSWHPDEQVATKLDADVCVMKMYNGAGGIRQESCDPEKYIFVTKGPWKKE